MNCWHCHTCGTKLRSVLDGEEWCPKCETYRRYYSHGWAHGEGQACPERGLTPVAADAATASQNQAVSNAPPRR